MSREYRMWMDKICLKFNMLQNSLSVIRYSLFKNYFLPKNGKISTQNTLSTTYYLLLTT